MCACEEHAFRVVSGWLNSKVREVYVTGGRDASERCEQQNAGGQTRVCPVAPAAAETAQSATAQSAGACGGRERSNGRLAKARGGAEQEGRGKDDGGRAAGKQGTSSWPHRGRC